MNMGENTNDSNRRVLLFIHNVVSKCNKQLREHFQNKLRFEIFGRVGHDHGKTFL